MHTNTRVCAPAALLLLLQQLHPRLVLFPARILVLPLEEEQEVEEGEEVGEEEEEVEEKPERQ